jgi:hypothetical protein
MSPAGGAQAAAASKTAAITADASTAVARARPELVNAPRAAGQ